MTLFIRVSKVNTFLYHEYGHLFYSNLKNNGVSLLDYFQTWNFDVYESPQSQHMFLLGGLLFIVFELDKWEFTITWLLSNVSKVNMLFFLYLNWIDDSVWLPDYFQNRNFDIYKNVKSQYVVFNGEHYDLLNLNLTYDCVWFSFFYTVYGYDYFETWNFDVVYKVPRVNTFFIARFIILFI